MQENIWSPAKMENTDIEDSNVEYENKADVYIKLASSFYRCPQNDLSHTNSGGGIQSTAEDMLKFGQAILNYELINSKTTEMMIQLSNKTSNDKEYVLVWDSWITPEQGKVIEHNGKQIGCSSYFRIFFDKKVVVATIVNNMNSREEVRDLSIKLSYELLNRKRQT